MSKEALKSKYSKRVLRDRRRTVVLGIAALASRQSDHVRHDCRRQTVSDRVARPRA